MMNMNLVNPMMTAEITKIDSIMEKRLPPKKRPMNPPMLLRSSMIPVGLNVVTYKKDWITLEG